MPNCTAPDNGTAGWFMENFRNLLVMEDGQSLWVARATPRVWLEQGKKIAVKNAPTYFGTLAYEIVSDVDHGKIAATVEMPSRNPPKSVVRAVPSSQGGANQERDGQREGVERFRPGEGNHSPARCTRFCQGGGGLLTFLFRFDVNVCRWLPCRVYSRWPNAAAR